MYHAITFDRPNDHDLFGNVVTRTNILAESNVRAVFGSNSFQLGMYGGKYFGTILKNPYVNANFTFFHRLGILASYNYIDYGDQPNGTPGVKQSIFSIKADLRIIQRLFLRTYFQRDTYSRIAEWNSLIQYEFFGGSSVYLVLNFTGDRLEYTQRYFKVAYDVNF